MSERERVRAERTAAFFGLYGELSSQSGFEKIGQYAQHGSTTRLVHSVAVAYYSYRLAFFLGLSGLLMAAGFSTGSWGLVALGVLFLVFTAGMAAHKLRRRKRK